MNSPQVVELGEVRSVWTPKDEAALAELMERKTRIMESRRRGVSNLVQRMKDDEIEMVEFLIVNADAMTAALAPFCSQP